ncbi:MAG: cation diffusion facilitator family transporter [Actinomycetota bacterium]
MAEHEEHTHHEADAASPWRRLTHRLGHVVGHDHDHGESAGSLIDSGAEGIRATKISLIGLGITAAIQAVIVLFSGSVALLSDTLHNLADALTAIPLWIAFALGRRAPTRRYTYGLNRAEDLAGLAIVGAIGLSAVLVIWESARRIAEPRLMEHIPWVIAAGFVGALGNEFVARYRIRVGRRIGSEALVADGSHARSDALTSLAVVVAGVGAAFGAAWVDPVAGLTVAVVILWILVRSARRMWRRVLDGIEPEIVDDVEETIRSTPDVLDVTDLRVRWHGHQLRIETAVAVRADASVREGHDTAHEVEHALHHRFAFPVAAVIHVTPHGVPDAHDSTAHHHQ